MKCESYCYEVNLAGREYCIALRTLQDAHLVAWRIYINYVPCSWVLVQLTKTKY